MYKVEYVETRRPIIEFTQDEALSIIEKHPRANLEFNLRKDLLKKAKAGEGVISVPPYGTGLTHFDKYIDFLCKPFGLVPKGSRSFAFPSWGVSSKPSCYFTSATADGSKGLGGFESALMSIGLYNVDAIHVKGLDFNTVGLNEGFLPLLGFALGYATVYIGDELYSGADYTPLDRLASRPETISDVDSVEYTNAWWKAFNEYHGFGLNGRSLQSIVGLLHKTEIVKKAQEMFGSISSISTCFNYTPDTPYCGNCWKCFSTKAITGDESIELTTGCIEDCNKQINDYKTDGTDPFRSCGILDGL